MITFGDDGRDALIYAFRYTLGRLSYAPSTVIGLILNNWDELSTGDKNLFKREILEFYEQFPTNDFSKDHWMKIVEKDN